MLLIDPSVTSGVFKLDSNLVNSIVVKFHLCCVDRYLTLTLQSGPFVELIKRYCDFVSLIVVICGWESDMEDLFKQICLVENYWIEGQRKQGGPFHRITWTWMHLKPDHRVRKILD